jgi:hypothetical protein
MIRIATSGTIVLLGACAPAAPSGVGSPAPQPTPAMATATILVTRAGDTLAFNDSTRSVLLPSAGAVEWRIESAGLGALSALGDSLLVSRDPAVIGFASASERFIVTPLRWDLTYVLVARAPTDVLPAESSGVDQVRRDLATTAVQVAAQPAASMYWWEDQVLCDSSIAAASRVRPAIGYPADDSTAGQIASRLAATSSGGVDRVTAEQLAARELSFALADGRLAGIVIPVGTAPGSPLPSSLACSATLTPLIDVRAHFIRRVLP